MKILALNCGSSSVKYQLYDTDANKLLAKGAIERIGFVGTFIIHQTKYQKHRLECECSTHKDAIYTVFKFLTDEEFGVIAELNQIDAVGHRIVQSGVMFNESVLIDDKVISAIDSLYTTAPIHTPQKLEGMMDIK